MAQLESLKRAKAKYRQKCVKRNITFYSNDKDKELLEFSKTINFQGEVKKYLAWLLDYSKDKK